MSTGSLVAIAIRAKSRAPMVELDRVEITAEQGVSGDFRGQPGPRQVTVVAAEAWSAACSSAGQDLPWTTRRANLLVEGIELANTARQTLRMGSVVLRITAETEPCQRMEEQCDGLLAALTPGWRGGVSCEVVSGGVVEVGVPVVLDKDGQND